MNDRTKKVLEHLLKQKEAWKIDQLRYGWVVDQLSDELQTLFYDQWYWPTAKIVFKWIKTALPHYEWDCIDVGFSERIVLDYCYELELADMFEAKFADVVNDAWRSWFEIPSFDHVMKFSDEFGLTPPKPPEQLSFL